MSIILTLEKGVKCARRWQEKHQSDGFDVVLMYLLLTLKMLQTFL